eukprot:jgi/Chlat1/8139/Chrsp75S00607
MVAGSVGVGSAGSAPPKLKRLLARYYPPGVVVEYEQGGRLRQRTIDLLGLHPNDDVDEVVDQVLRSDPVLLPPSRRAAVTTLVGRLLGRARKGPPGEYALSRVLRAHALPLTNCAFDKAGERFVTGSYDRTARVWNTSDGKELACLEGHRNVVYCVAFNNPYGDLVATGSFDRTARVWSVGEGSGNEGGGGAGKDATSLSSPQQQPSLCALRGHSAELVCIAWAPVGGNILATGSMDATARLWDVSTGIEVATLAGHAAEIVSVAFATDGNRVITGSFDGTARIWDVRTGRCTQSLAGHAAEVSTASLSYSGSLAATASIDRSARLWDAGSGRCVETWWGHEDEVLDVAWDAAGTRVVSASADGTARVWAAGRGGAEAEVVLVGHGGEISKATFSMQGSRILTASADRTARLWNASTGRCLQVLEGHTDEIFSCAFNYEADTVITGSKDNTCRIWKATS